MKRKKKKGEEKKGKRQNFNFYSSRERNANKTRQLRVQWEEGKKGARECKQVKKKQKTITRGNSKLATSILIQYTMIIIE